MEGVGREGRCHGQGRGKIMRVNSRSNFKYKIEPLALNYHIS